MEEKIWNKFHPLFGPDLKVAFETTFPKAVVLDLDPLYEKSGLIYESSKETIRRIYEPAEIFRFSFSTAVQVLFEPVSSTGSLFRRLVFAKKIGHSAQKSRCWVVAARHGEIATFGFDSWNTKDQRYLALGYGINEQFIPVYFKIQDRKEESFVYLEVWAWDNEPQVVVQARIVNESEAPKSLHSAQPGLVYSIY